MRRTGSGLALLALLASAPALADVEFYQTVDRTEVGTEETFRLTLVVSGAPDGAQVQFPAPKDFEVLSRSQSTQMSYHLGGGGPGVIQRVQKYVVVMRATRPGSLTIPPAVLATAGRTYRTDSVKMTVKPGRLRSAPQAQAQPDPVPDPFRNLPFPGMPDPEDLFPEDLFPEEDIPRSDSDLFLRAYVDKETPYVGEQVTLSVYIFSRVELSSVDAVTMPKLDGFWSEDFESPTQLAAERRVIGGVEYKAYLIKRRALFAVRPGTLTIQPAEVDVTTGYLFAGRRVHRAGNELKLRVKPLPPGAPADFPTANVGRWRLSTELSQTQVELGKPVTLRLVAEGRGNLKNLELPSVGVPAALKVYDPSTTDRVAHLKGSFGGRRALEYLVMPQQTGTFTLPGMALHYFDPAAGRYEVSRTDPITLTVLPGNAPMPVPNGDRPVAGPSEPTQKNQLSANGLRPLRHQAQFRGSSVPVWSRPFFVPVAAAPALVFLGFALAGWLKGRVGGEDESTRKKRQARAARERLAAAERLQKSGNASEFYGEVEKALLSFLEAKLGIPVGGLTREVLAQRLAEAGVAAGAQKQIVAVLEACDLGRFAPGAAGTSMRQRALEVAAAAMETWDQ